MIVTGGKKLNEKPLKLSTSDTSYFLPEVSTYELMPSGECQSFSNISTQKCKNKKMRESFANFAA